MDKRTEAIDIIENLSEIKLSYILQVIKRVRSMSDQEVKRKMYSVDVFSELSDYMQSLPNLWENEEELFAEMMADRREKRAMVSTADFTEEQLKELAFTDEEKKEADETLVGING